MLVTGPPVAIAAVDVAHSHVTRPRARLPPSTTTEGFFVYVYFYAARRSRVAGGRSAMTRYGEDRLAARFFRYFYNRRHRLTRESPRPVFRDASIRADARHAKFVVSPPCCLLLFFQVQCNTHYVCIAVHECL